MCILWRLQKKKDPGKNKFLDQGNFKILLFTVHGYENMSGMDCTTARPQDTQPQAALHTADLGYKIILLQPQVKSKILS